MDSMSFMRLDEQFRPAVLTTAITITNLPPRPSGDGQPMARGFRVRHWGKLAPICGPGFHP
jgi:hypothetical protein